MLDDLLEVGIELLLEPCFALCLSQKLPKWVRYPLLGLVSLFFLAFFALLYFLCWLAWQFNPWLGLVCFALTSVLLYLGIIKFRKRFSLRKEKTQTDQYKDFDF